MRFRRKTSCGAIACLTLALVALCGTRAAAQGTTSSATVGSSAGAGRTGVANFTGGSGSNSNATSSSNSSGSFTGTSASTATAVGGGYTGGGNASTGFTGSTGMSAAQATTGTATLAPGVSNILQPTYYNPYNAGLVNTNGQALNNSNAAFGQPSYSTIYSTAASSTSGTGTAMGGSGGVVASTMVTGGVGFGYNTYGQGRTYNYVAVPGATLHPVVHTNPKLQTTIADMLERTASFKALAPLQVAVNDSTVTIEGTVASTKERRIVEGMIRMTPGVRAVVNNLQIAATPPSAKTAAPPAGP